MTRPITMLDSVGSPDIESAVPGLLRLLGPQLDAIRESRPVLTLHTVAEPREQAQNPAA